MTETTDIGGAVREPRGLAGVVSQRLAHVLDRRVSRLIAALAAGFLTYATVQGGLFTYAAWLQAGILVALVVGLTAERAEDAAIAGGLAYSAGAVLVPGLFGGTSVQTLGGAAVALVVGAVLRVALRAYPAAARPAFWFAIAMIVVNLWVTVIVVDNSETMNPDTGVVSPPLFTQLDGKIGSGVVLDSDDYFYLRVVQRLDAGEPYYRAVRDGIVEINRQGAPPTSVLNFRMPVLASVLSGLPTGVRTSVFLLLALVTGCIVCVPFLLRGSVVLPLAIPAAAAFAAYFAQVLCSLIVLYTEPWAICLGVLSMAALAIADSAMEDRWWLVASAGLALAAALVREPMAVLLVSGLVWAVVSKRRLDMGVWGGALVLFGGAFAAHYAAASEYVVAGSAYAFQPGSFLNVVMGFTYGTLLFNDSTWVPLVFAALGATGLAVLAVRRVGRTMALHVGVLVASFLFVANGAQNLETGSAINYWGMLVSPFLFAATPAAFALLPALAPAARRVVSVEDGRESSRNGSTER